MNKKVRVRFAPSPTGFLHLGNIRAALLNFLFARQRNGVFVLRIEDTDQARNVDEAGLKIIEDLKWLNLSFDEGPYLQSDRINLYQQHLDDLIAQQKVYRCFCSKEILEQKRKAQLESGQPPRYDRTCLHLSDDEVAKNLAGKKPFIWRFKVNHDQVITVRSMARKELKFDMKNFSDFALTRADGSFTFLFANFVDDWLMEITHVIRGEDHLSNTAMQGALFDALAVECPTFWHLPILCNAEGKKLSKRDFGFALDDLKTEGFLAEAICNYLAIIGGTFKDEIQSLDELIHNFDFDNLHSTGAIKYDVEKLYWINHKWIERCDIKMLVPQIVPFLHREIHASKEVPEERLIYLIEKVKSDCKTLKDFVGALRFCFEKPEIDIEEIDKYVGKDKANEIAALIDHVIEFAPQRDLFLETLKREGKEAGLKPKEFMGVVRYLLTGNFHGLGLHEVLDMLDDKQIMQRIGLVI
jgi:glutamyl-tRNA synthetase